MPSIYDYRHVELDKVGRGKRVIKAPGGGSSQIFTDDNKPVNLNSGSCSETESVDGSVFSCPSTPVHHGNGTNGLSFGYESDSSTPSSASSSRRGSLQDTKNRLFGQNENGLESPRRRVVNRMKSSIFPEGEQAPVATTAGGVTRSPSVKKYEHVVRRNPITGEVFAESKPSSPVANGCSPSAPAVSPVPSTNGNVNGTNGSASSSVPNTPSRVRQPPGGKSSNIFG